MLRNGERQLLRRLIIARQKGNSTLKTGRLLTGRLRDDNCCSRLAVPASVLAASGLWSRLGISQCRFFSSKEEASSDNKKPLYLHVGPSGDVWTGDSIFAAKHLQPDYVKSVSLEGEPPAIAEGNILIEVLEERSDWAQEVYDSGKLPDALRERLQQLSPRNEDV